MKALALCLLVLLPACSDSSETRLGAAAETPEELRRRMDLAIAELEARPEHQSPRVTIQHLLVAVTGGGVPGAHRTPAEAGALAAELLARTRLGEDFDTLVKNHTDEAHPGIYTLSLEPGTTPGVHPRADVVACLGDVAWRLQVGEVGVAPYDGGVAGHEPRSPHGYHLIKRLE